MPRTSKRKAVPPITSSDVDSSVRSEPKRLRTKQVDRIDQLFESYANKSLGLIDPEGIEALCSDVRVDYTDVKILILAWKMKAEKQGYFSKVWKGFITLRRAKEITIWLYGETLPTVGISYRGKNQVDQDEWRRGLKCLGADTLTKLIKAVAGLEKEVIMPESFEDFYSYAFRYCLTEEKQRSIDIETACELLKVVLRSQFPTQVDSLIEYLKIQNDYRALTMDQWINFYRFFKEVSFQDLGSYDSSQAWPVILDNFVEWMKEREKRNVSFGFP